VFAGDICSPLKFTHAADSEHCIRALVTRNTSPEVAQAGHTAEIRAPLV
jgi:hypothetical protein